MKIKEIIKTAVDNVMQDREDATEMLEDIAGYIGANPDRYKEYGMVAAKYLEVKQRSNEQLIKLAEQARKGGDDMYGDLSEEDKDDMYDEIENDDENTKDE